MTLLELARTVVAHAGALSVALVAGDLALQLIERVARRGRPPSPAAEPSATRLGAALLIGLGVLSSIGAGLGLLGIFHPLSLAAVGGLVVIAGRRRVVHWAAYLRGRAAALHSLLRDGASLVLMLPTLLILIANYGAALAPPHAWDELVYHLPNAEQVASSGRLPLTFDGLLIHANLPKLMEVLYAEGLALAGPTLAHLLHLSVLAAFLLFVFGTLQEFYGRRAALLSVLLLVLFDPLVHNATTAYIDAATAAFSVAAVLAAGAWAQRGRLEDAGRSAAFLGLALGTRYLALSTVIFVAAVGVLVVVRRGAGLRRALALAVPLGAVVTTLGGFWYVKNLVHVGNPIYPLVFGHRGMSDSEYAYFVEWARASAGSHSLGDLVLFPTRYETLGLLPTFLALYLAPFALLVRRFRALAAILVAYLGVAFAGVFLVVTSDDRYLMLGPVTAALLIAIAVAGPTGRRTRVALGGAALAALALAAPIPASPVEDLKAKLRAADARFALGLETEDEYLARYFGCQYDALAFLRGEPAGAVIDNWTNPFFVDAVSSYYSNRRFVRFAPHAAGAAATRRAAERAGARYLFVNERLRRQILASDESALVRYRARRAAAERNVVGRSMPVFRSGECVVYRIPAAQGDA